MRWKCAYSSAALRYSGVQNRSPWCLIYFWGFVPALVSYWEPGCRSKGWLVRFLLAPNLVAAIAGQDPQPAQSVHEVLQLWNELSRFAIQTRHKLPCCMVGCAHKLEQVLRDGYIKLIKYEHAKEEASTVVNAQASQDVASSSSSDLAAKPAANVAPKPKPSPRPSRGKPKPLATSSMAPINHHFPPLPDLPPFLLVSYCLRMYLLSSTKVTHKMRTPPSGRG